MSGVRWMARDDWWGMSCVRWVLWDEWCEMSGVWRVMWDEWLCDRCCEMSGVRWMVWDGCWEMSCVRWVVWDEWYEMTGESWVVRDERCEMSAVRWAVCEESCEMSGVRWAVVWWALWDEWCGMNGMRWLVRDDRAMCVSGMRWLWWGVTGERWGVWDEWYEIRWMMRCELYVRRVLLDVAPATQREAAAQPAQARSRSFGTTAPATQRGAAAQPATRRAAGPSEGSVYCACHAGSDQARSRTFKRLCVPKRTGQHQALQKALCTAPATQRGAARKESRGSRPPGAQQDLQEALWGEDRVRQRD